MITTQQLSYNQRVQKDCVEYIKSKKEVNNKMGSNKQKKNAIQISKKSKPISEDVENISSDSKKTENQTAWKSQKQDYVKKVIAFAKEEFSELSDTKLRSVLSGAYFVFNAEIKDKK